MGIRVTVFVKVIVWLLMLQVGFPSLRLDWVRAGVGLLGWVLVGRSRSFDKLPVGHWHAGFKFDHGVCSGVVWSRRRF